MQAWASRDTDLVRLVRDLQPWLDDAIGSRRALTVDVPDDMVLALGSTPAFELWLMTPVAFAADAGDSVEVRLALRLEPELALSVEARGCDAAEDAAAWIERPATCEDAVLCASFAALHELARHLERGWTWRRRALAIGPRPFARWPSTSCLASAT